MNNPEYDLFIIGGGINGCGIAADAASRGLKVALCESNDLASATSSASSKLIHGGIRYLEHYEFGLVRKALSEREVLLNNAPHIIYPWRFVLPHNKQLRPAFLIRIGLLLYDYLAPRQRLEKSKRINLSKHPYGLPLQSTCKTGFVYSDCWVNDSRLVILNAMQAQQQGAAIMTRTTFMNAKRHAAHWLITLKDQHSQKTRNITSKALINAAGPWVENIIQQIGITSQYKIKLVKGSHIVVPKLYEGSQAYILQTSDKRVIFTEPYEQHYTLIGTTDVLINDIAECSPEHMKPSEEEERYLCEQANSYFKCKVTPSDIIWRYAGVRPLRADDADTPAEVTRDYTIELLGSMEHAYLVNIFGGKITTYRRLAEQVLKKLSIVFPQLTSYSCTQNKTLPGGDIPGADLENYCQIIRAQYPWLPTSLVNRYVKTYGTLTKTILKNCINIKDLGVHFGVGLYEKEVIYLQNNEWARSVDDILWRRTKLGLHMSEKEKNHLTSWLKSNAKQT